VRVELRDVAALGRHQLLFLGGLGECGACERGWDGAGGPDSGGAFEKIAAE
jgi:hypothetical protein